MFIHKRSEDNDPPMFESRIRSKVSNSFTLLCNFISDKIM